MKNKEKKFWYNLFKILLGWVFVLYYRPKIKNKEVIPKEGPIIICGNHIHLFDQCFPIISTKRMIHYMAKKEHLDGKFGWFFKLSGCISVDRSVHDKNAKEKALEVLKNNQALGIFPEGTRNRTKEILQPLKYGAVSLAKKTDATIVPYAITGKYKFWNNNLKATFGKPFKVGDMSLDEANLKLREELIRLIEENK